VQNIQGTVHLGAQAKELLELANRFGGNEASDLESAVYELEDAASPVHSRLRARQRIKGFLLRLGDNVEAVGLAVLQKYVENKLGLP
jgi:hypothetical protein